VGRESRRASRQRRRSGNAVPDRSRAAVGRRRARRRSAGPYRASAPLATQSPAVTQKPVGPPIRKNACRPAAAARRREMRAAAFYATVIDRIRRRFPMKALTLVTKRLYFGLDALQLRDATGRVLSRVHGLPPHRATVRLDGLAQDLRVTPSASRALADEMVESGLLHRLGPDGYEYGITDKFRQYALARIVEPLPRTRAKILLDHIAELAGHSNRTATQNKYEIEAIAVFGGYMSLDAGLAELSVGVTGR